MAAMIPIMIVSILSVRRLKNYEFHKRLQISLGIVLGLAIFAFEIDMRSNGWQHLAQVSPYYDSLVFPALFVHLAFAVPTLFLWIYTIFMALKHRLIQSLEPPRFRHKLYGRLSALGMIATTLTGWLFFWLAFMA